MIPAPAVRGGGFKTCCLTSGRYDGAERKDYFQGVNPGAIPGNWHTDFKNLRAQFQGAGLNNSCILITSVPPPSQRFYLEGVHPAGGQLITVQRRGVDAGEREEPGPTVLKAGSA